MRHKCFLLLNHYGISLELTHEDFMTTPRLCQSKRVVVTVLSCTKFGPFIFGSRRQSDEPPKSSVQVWLSKFFKLLIYFTYGDLFKRHKANLSVSFFNESPLCTVYFCNCLSFTMRRYYSSIVRVLNNLLLLCNSHV